MKYLKGLIHRCRAHGAGEKASPMSRGAKAGTGFIALFIHAF